MGQALKEASCLRRVLDGDEEGRRSFPIALAHLISNASEDCYCAGWLIDCEHELWEAATKPGDFDWGMGDVPRLTLDTMLGLSAQCRGWVRWVEDVGAQFIPLTEWLTLHEEWIAARAARIRSVAP